MAHEKKKAVQISMFSKVLILWALFICLVTAFAIGAKFEERYFKLAALKAYENKKVAIQKDNSAAYTYSVIDGSLYKVFAHRPSELIVDKAKLEYENYGPYTVKEYFFSPDRSKVIVEAETYNIDSHVLFLIECAGGMSTPIGIGGSPVWSSNGQYIAYRIRNADIGPHSIQAFDTIAKTNITVDLPKNAYMMDFYNLKWADNNAINASYKLFNDIPNGKVIKEGELTIKLSNSTTSEE